MLCEHEFVKLYYIVEATNTPLVASTIRKWLFLERAEDHVKNSNKIVKTDDKVSRFNAYIFLQQNTRKRLTASTKLD